MSNGSVWSLVAAVVITIPATPAAADTGPVVVISNEIGLVEMDPAVAHNGTADEYLVVWYNDRPGNDDIRARRLRADGTTVGPRFYVSAGPGADRRKPDVAYNSTAGEYLVVWEHRDTAVGGGGIHARRVSGAGLVLGVSDLVVDSPLAPIVTSTPAVAYGSTSNNYLVVWRRTNTTQGITEIVAQLVHANGSLDGLPLSLHWESSNDPHPRNPDVTYNRRRNEFLVVWQSYDSTHLGFRISGSRITPAGALFPTEWDLIYTYHNEDKTDPAVAVLPDEGTEGAFLIAYNDDDFLVGEVFPGDLDDLSSYYLGFEVESAEGYRPAVAGQESTGVFWMAHSRQAPPPLASEWIYGYPFGGARLLGNEQYLGGFFARRPDVAAGAAPQSFLTVFDDFPIAASDRGIYAVLWDPVVFVDGFESGSTAAWTLP